MKTVIISGVSRGIGFKTAEHFKNQGWRVISLSRTKNGQAINCCVDLSGDWPIDELLSHIKNPHKICLVHNASLHVSDTAMKPDIENLEKSFNVNIKAPMLLNAALLPQMQVGSSIIYIGSTLSEKAVPNSFSYCTFKHAAIGMMRATCQDLMDLPVHTACVCPGFTETKMLTSREGGMDIAAKVAKFGKLIQP